MKKSGDTSKKKPKGAAQEDVYEGGSERYKKTLHALQVELVKLQRQIIAGNEKILVIFEGRDAAGKDGAIKRITEYLSPRETRTVALGKPSDAEAHAWYFQRYARYLPMSQDMVLFNRSWYNRAGVEWVMGFCTEAEHEVFLESVPEFERMLVRSGVKLFKYYLDISKDEQRKRLKARALDPLKQWKLSPIDGSAIKYWKQYSEARNEMLTRTHSKIAPWTVVRANDKQAARINIIRDLLNRLPYKGKDKKLLKPDSDIVFTYDRAQIKAGLIEP